MAHFVGEMGLMNVIELSSVLFFVYGFWKTYRSLFEYRAFATFDESQILYGPKMYIASKYLEVLLFGNHVELVYISHYPNLWGITWRNWNQEAGLLVLHVWDLRANEKAHRRIYFLSTTLFVSFRKTEPLIRKIWTTVCLIDQTRVPFLFAVTARWGVKGSSVISFSIRSMQQVISLLGHFSLTNS
jgi:hypothetical protein